MRNDSGGAFSLDLVIALGILIAWIGAAVLFTMSTLAVEYTDQYSVGLKPLAERIGDTLVESPGAPNGWHLSPDLARGATIIGLSDGSPCILSSEKVYSLSFFNATELGRHLALDDSENTYGIRIEVSTDDGSISVASGYVVDDGTLDVVKSTRLVLIRQPDGVERSGKLIVLLWREHAGTRAADF
ncbi:hypothetical protein [Methanocella arvoryzae]|uniref:Uncharacterized protein n=1 Tax=Methanocella arvoryzae (strain DSM 22066 / NBRC 105507 / MRE50) TaxID=351160 RepID=Q0W6E8_METAR|nr:hypothetical protein [Methanocella arvoryzae]CAJ36045.1 hypothetical protein RCIX644 [Methanocella arvoryzae MRE50]